MQEIREDPLNNSESILSWQKFDRPSCFFATTFPVAVF